MTARTIPAAMSFFSRSKRHATTTPAATSGTTWPTLTACSTHHGERAPMTAIQRLIPVLMPAHASPAAKAEKVSTAHTENASQYGNSVRGATSHATSGGLQNG